MSRLVLRMAEFGITGRPRITKVARNYRRGDEKSVARQAARKALTPLSLISGNHDEVPGLRLFTSVEPLEQQWRQLEKNSHASLYQSWLWCKAWVDTVGKSLGIEPRIAVISGFDGEVAAIVPLQIRRRLGVRVLEWLGAPHITYGLFLAAQCRPRIARWIEANWPGILELAGPADAIQLAEMPDELDGKAHPLRAWFNIVCPNRSFRMTLGRDYELLLASKRSGETRRHYRKRERALAELGTLWFGLPEDKSGVHATLDTMFAQQEVRLAEHGVHDVFGEAERGFVHRLADLQDMSEPVLLPYTLKHSGEIQAVMLGGAFAGTYWALISSLSANSLRKYSIGDLALRRTIEACCEGGMRTFDFATGDSEYKSHWADEGIKLCAQVEANNWRGLLWVSLVFVHLTAKRQAKQWPVTRRIYNDIRRVLWARPLRQQPA